MSKIVKFLSLSMVTACVSISLIGFYYMGQYDEFVSNTERFAYCGVLTGLMLLMLAGGACSDLMVIKEKLEENSKNQD
jgi:hypothetical protein